MLSSALIWLQNSGFKPSSRVEINQSFLKVEKHFKWTGLTVWRYLWPLTRGCSVTSAVLYIMWYLFSFTWFLSWAISLLLGALFFMWSIMIWASANSALVLFRSFLKRFSASMSPPLTCETGTLEVWWLNLHTQSRFCSISSNTEINHTLSV